MTAPASAATSPVDRPEFRLGVRLHNEGAFYEAHEAWEHVWRDEEDDAHRRFVQGLIQITAGFHKAIVEGMPKAARRLFERGLEKIEPFDAVHLGVELGAFRDAVRSWMARSATDQAAPDPVPRLVLRDAP